MRSEPLVSTIIPAYNAAGTLRQAVRSVLSQGIEDAEVIIVDDGSTDATLSIAEELALGDDRVWVSSQPNSGVSEARNTGLRGARGQWLHFLDADDWVLPRGLKRLIEAAQRSGLEAACGGSALFDERGHSLGWSYGVDVPQGVSVGVTELLERNRFQPGASVVRRERLAGMAFDERVEPSEDWDLWLRLSERGLRWAVVGEDVAAYRLRRAGASRQFATMATAMRAVIEGAFERCRANHASVVPASALRQGRMHDALRRVALHQATASAWDDPSADGDGAFTVLLSAWPAGERGEARSATIRADDLGEAAYWMIPFASGLAPGAWASADPAWLSGAARALSVFWGRCGREGMVAPAEVNLALEDLAARAVPPAEVARALARKAALAVGNGRGVTLVGLGRNAAHAAAALRERGIGFDARDDAAGPGPLGASFASVGGCEIEVLGADAPYNPSTLHVVTVSDDAGPVSRLPTGIEVLRWSVERRALGARILARLRAAWPPDASRGRLGAAA